MRVVVDTATCLSNGLCESIAPEVFVVGDDDVAHVLCDPVPEQHHSAVENAVRMCPMNAISLEDRP